VIDDNDNTESPGSRFNLPLSIAGDPEVAHFDKSPLKSSKNINVLLPLLYALADEFP
jgi:hypothetical protein